MSNEIGRITLAASVVEPTMFRATKQSDILVLKVDIGNGEKTTIKLPLNAEGMESLDPLLDAIAEEEFLSLEIVKYV